MLKRKLKMMLKRKTKMWSLTDAQDVIDSVQLGARNFGFHVALGGSVLNTGESNKDLDLYFLPLNQETPINPTGLVAWLKILWGEGGTMQDENYPPCPFYTHKLKFFPLMSKSFKRIDVFLTGPFRTIHREGELLAD